jgi:hypothetical protein
MATFHVPSTYNQFSWNSALETYIKQEKFVFQDEESYNKWLNVDHLPSLNTLSDSSLEFFTPNQAYQVQSNNPTLCYPQGQSYSFVPFSAGFDSGTCENSFTSIQLPQVFTSNSSDPYQTTFLPQQKFKFSQQGQIREMEIPQFYDQLINSFRDQNYGEQDDRKKRVRTHQRPKRQTRPKVVESKGAIQCKGMNRKKASQCKNAALMEYIGPRPIYCAEHIELDPCSLYEKCKSPYQKEANDKKGCKEVVLKEFGTCYKHFPNSISELLRSHEYEKIRIIHQRVCELLTQLEKEAMSAKKKDGDLYQRKNKLIPKFQEMKRTTFRALESLKSNFSEEIFPSSSLSANDDDLESHSLINSQ